MLSLLDIAERVQKGPKMDEKEWDLTLFKTVNEIANKYGIKPPDDVSFFNLNDSLIENAYEAGIEFLANMGLYCITTRRVVKFDENEIRSAIEEAPNEITVGEGRDARVIKQKKPEGNERLNHCPGHHAPFSEELAPLIVKNYAQIATGDYLEGFNFGVVDGRKIFGIASEAYASKREVSWMREGIRKAGRPGMAIAYYPINTKASTLIAPIDPEYGLRRTDGILLSLLPSSKMELDMLTAAIVYEEYGCFKINGGGDSAVGGFAGGTEGCVVESIAKTIAGWLVYRDVISVPGVWDIRKTTAKTLEARPEYYWGWSLVLQTLNTKTNSICMGDCVGSRSGPGTETHLLEIGLCAVHNAINGANLWVNRQARARMDASQTPLEPEFMWEIADATIKAGITRKEGNTIIRKIAAITDGREIENGPDHIQECYDLVHHKPKEAYHQIYLKVKKIFREAGVPV